MPERKKSRSNNKDKQTSKTEVGKNVSEKKKFITFKKPKYSLKETMSHVIKRINVISSLIIFFVIAFGISFFIIFYFWNKSCFLKHLPSGTEKFSHFKIYNNNIPFSEQLMSFFDIKFSESDFEKLKELKIHHITFYGDKSNSIGFLLERITKKQAQKFFSYYAQESSFDFKSIKAPLIHSRNGEQFYCLYKSFVLDCAKNESLINKPREDAKVILSLKKDIINLSKSSPVLWYINNSMLKKPFLNVHKDIIKRIYGDIGFIDSKQQKVIMHIYADLNREFEIYKSNIKRQYLAKQIPISNNLIFLSGQNFKQKWEYLEKYYTNKVPEYALILKGVLLGKIKSIFGNEIDFYSDILPILNNGYAISISKNQKEQANLNIIAESFESKDLVNLDKIFDTFFKNRGEFTVEKKEYKVSDDILLSQVYSEEDKVKKVNERVGLTRITGYVIKDKPFGIYKARKGNLIYISTSLDDLKELLMYKEKSLDDLFGHELKNAYEFGYISIKNISDLYSFIPFSIPENNSFKDIKSVTWETEEHQGGMSLYAVFEKNNN